MLRIKINVWGFGVVRVMYFVIFFWIILLVNFVLNKLGVLIMLIFLLKWLVVLCLYFFVIDDIDKFEKNFFFFKIVFLVVFFLDLVLLMSIIFNLFLFLFLKLFKEKKFIIINV